MWSPHIYSSRQTQPCVLIARNFGLNQGLCFDCNQSIFFVLSRVLCPARGRSKKLRSRPASGLTLLDKQRTYGGFARHSVPAQRTWVQIHIYKLCTFSLSGALLPPNNRTFSSNILKSHRVISPPECATNITFSTGAATPLLSPLKSSATGEHAPRNLSRFRIPVLVPSV
jgi:hypothetical protein